MPALPSTSKTWAAFMKWIAAGVGFALVSLALYAFWQDHPWRTLSIGLVVAAAASLAGGLAGFIFGVPRVLAVDGPRAGSPGAGPARSTIVANTNLEQISDWLTKILVGVGLTQFGAIAAGARRLFGALAPALGGGEVATVFAGGLVTYSAVFGFITGWLYTRLLLGGAMADADRRATALSLIEAAKDAERSGDDQSAREFREQARELLDQTSDLSLANEQARPVTPAGPPPTSTLDDLAGQARRLAADLPRLDPQDLRAMVHGGSDGQRATALGLMRGRPEFADVDAVVELIREPRSPYEQHQALLLARDILAGLTVAGRERITEVIEAERPRLDRGSDRYRLADEILTRAGAAS
jgi:hypothetical protein